MRRTSRNTVVAAAAGLALVALPGAALADGHGHGDRDGDLLRSGVVGSTPSPAGATLFGVAPGGAPWVTSDGAVRVRRDGRLDLEVEGLVIPIAPFNGTNPVPTVTATLYCNAAPAAVTRAFPLSKAGNARFRGTLRLPATCVAPVVLLNPGGNAAFYIAATG